MLLLLYRLAIGRPRETKKVCARRSSKSSSATPAEWATFFPPHLPRVRRDLLAMTYYYNMYYGSADVGRSRETFMVHTRSCTCMCYNMVCTRSLKSCVRGKTREKTGTESCPCVRRLFANEYVVLYALPSFAKYYFGDRDRYVRSTIIAYTSSRAYIMSPRTFR